MDSNSPSLLARVWNYTWAITPGVLLSVVAVGISIAINQVFPTFSALLIAIILGILVRNIVPLPTRVEPGLAFASKKLLRLGVVLLGLQLVFSDIMALGWGVIGIVVAVVCLGIFVTVAIGRAMGISFTQTLLIACGFSICGAAAVAAVDGVIKTKDNEEVVTAIALVVLFGTISIFLLPLLAQGLGFSEIMTGMWAGASVHEVAQVVAIGGAISVTALSVAVVIKLARVLMLAPVMTVLSVYQRRHQSEVGKKPPIMPLFVFGFIVMVVLRSLGVVPEVLLGPAKLVQTGFLAAAMFALGTGVKISMFKRVGAKPIVLAALSTVVVYIVGGVGVYLVSVL